MAPRTPFGPAERCPEKSARRAAGFSVSHGGRRCVRRRGGLTGGGGLPAAGGRQEGLPLRARRQRAAPPGAGRREGGREPGSADARLCVRGAGKGTGPAYRLPAPSLHRPAAQAEFAPSGTGPRRGLCGRSARGSEEMAAAETARPVSRGRGPLPACPARSSRGICSVGSGTPPAPSRHRPASSRSGRPGAGGVVANRAFAPRGRRAPPSKWRPGERKSPPRPSGCRALREPSAPSRRHPPAFPGSSRGGEKPSTEKSPPGTGAPAAAEQRPASRGAGRRETEHRAPGSPFSSPPPLPHRGSSAAALAARSRPRTPARLFPHGRGGECPSGTAPQNSENE